MSTVPAGESAYGAFPAATVAGGTRNTIQSGIAGTVTAAEPADVTTTRAQPDLRMRRLSKHRLNRTIQTTATVAVVNASVAVATDAIQTVRQNDRRPATLINGKRTGRIRRLAQGAVATFGALVAGSGYTNGSYTNVPLQRVPSTLGYLGGVAANITVAGGVVTVCTLVAARNGEGYLVGDLLTAVPGFIGTGTAFTIAVATVEIG